MHRRQLLISGGLISTLAVGGCVDADEAPGDPDDEEVNDIDDDVDDDPPADDPDDDPPDDATDDDPDDDPLEETVDDDPDDDPPDDAAADDPDDDPPDEDTDDEEPGYPDDPSDWLLWDDLEWEARDGEIYFAWHDVTGEEDPDVVIVFVWAGGYSPDDESWWEVDEPRGPFNGEPREVVIDEFPGDACWDDLELEATWSYDDERGRETEFDPYWVAPDDCDVDDDGDVDRSASPGVL